jgi:threonine dehydratase
MRRGSPLTDLRVTATDRDPTVGAQGVGEQGVPIPDAAVPDLVSADASEAAPAGASAPRSAGPTLEDFEAARLVVSAAAEITPMESSRYLAELLGSPVFLKCENLQRTGSYKIRGAYNRLSRLSPEERARGVVAASAGNHAQGVAFAARELGIRATIFMPVGVALPKLQATRQYGADVVLRGHTVAEPLIAAAEFAETYGAVLIPPFDHEDVIAGQGTVGLEILDQVPDLETVIVPIGGGGLISGVASVLKQRAAREGRSIRVIGVQASNAAAYPVSLEKGVPTEITVLPTIADGIAVSRPGILNFDIVKDCVDEVVTVTDDDTARALLVLLERAKLVVEPAGAVAVAAILTGQVKDAGVTVAILSGGNIDPLVMERVISRGLAASERYLKLKLMLPDRPGQLARVAELIAEASANVVEVLHTRHGKNALITDVELELSVETRGPEHVRAVLEHLRQAGYDPRIDY